MKLNALATAVMMLCLAGCSVLPQQRTQTESFKGAEALAGTNALTIRKIIEGEKTQALPNLTVTGSSNTVNITASPAVTGRSALSHDPLATPYHESLEVGNSSGQSATAFQDHRSKFAVSLPLGVALILAAIGTVGMVIAINFALNSSAGARSMAEAADEAIAKGARIGKAKIAALMDQAAKSTDPAVIADAHKEMSVIQQDIAERERERGLLARKAK